VICSSSASIASPHSRRSSGSLLTARASSALARRCAAGSVSGGRRAGGDGFIWPLGGGPGGRQPLRCAGAGEPRAGQLSALGGEAVGMTGRLARALRRLPAGLQQVLLGEADEDRVQGAGAHAGLLAELICRNANGPAG
jgi:hypothetical protein